MTTKIIAVVSKYEGSQFWNMEGKYYNSKEEAKKMIKFFKVKDNALDELHEKHFGEKSNRETGKIYKTAVITIDS